MGWNFGGGNFGGNFGGGFGTDGILSRKPTFLEENKNKTLGASNGSTPAQSSFDQTLESILPTGIKSYTDDTYNDVTGVTTAREVGAAQDQALGQALAAQEQGYQRSQEQLSPYAQAGGNFLEGLTEGVQSGEFDPGAFDYQGSQPGMPNYRGQQQGASDYEGQQQGGFDYNNGQQAQNAYRGGPEMGSIQSFMGDPSQDPGYQFRMDQGLKAVDRAAAAGGRFGGGQTAKELMRFAQGTAAQGYADDFSRAGQEREAQRFGEQEMYGRGMNDMQSRNQAENIGYGRDLNAFNLANQAEQSAYGRSETGLDRTNQAEQSRRDRAYSDYGLLADREQRGYGRERQGYNDQVQRMQDDYNRRLGMTNMGMDASTMMSNAALGEGSALSDLAIQRGNASAAQIAGEGTTAGNLLNLAGQGAKIYGAFG